MVQVGLYQGSPFLPPQAWDRATSLGLLAQSPILIALENHSQIQTKAGEAACEAFGSWVASLTGRMVCPLVSQSVPSWGFPTLRL